MSSTFQPTSTDTPTVLHGDRAVLDGFTRYADAQALVDRLSDRGFAVQHLAIVGTDIALVEDVTGRKRYGRAALEGATSGAVTGFVVGAFLSIFALFETVVGWFGMLASWTLLGAVVGAVLGMIGHAMQRGRRDFSSTASVVPGRYEVTVTADHLTEARRIADGDVTRSGTTR